MIFLDQDGFGNLIVPNTVSLIKNSPNNKNGEKLMDFLLSAKTEEMLAESCVQMPLHKGVPVPANVPSLDSIIPMAVDYGTVAKKSGKIKQYLKEWVVE
jgi:iron(III) transport system substrate-binding protein